MHAHSDPPLTYTPLPEKKEHFVRDRMLTFTIRNMNTFFTTSFVSKKLNLLADSTSV